ncbi:MAG TPA: hypothetical protein VLB85_14385 [Acidimicrobiia bacterium]|nr:hypothetical protein [Acidimicrobiia bacterium]
MYLADMFNPITSSALGRARHQHLLEEAAIRRRRRTRRATARNRSLPRSGTGRPLVDPV